MQPEELVKLVNDIRQTKAKTQSLELKAASVNCPTRLYDTLSSFSNQDEGGIIVFGIDEKDDFALKGVYDAQDLQAKVVSQCKQMEPVVRALFTVCMYDGKQIVSAEIPGVDISQRPVFYKGVGRVKGSYVRQGDADEVMSEYEIYSYEAFRKNIHEDTREVENVLDSLIDKERLDRYLQAVKKDKPNLMSSVNDNDLFELMGVKRNGKYTLASLLTFSKFPQAQFPQLCITAVVVPSTQMGDTDSSIGRFLDNKRITGSISEMLEQAMNFVERNSKTRTIINSKGKREDITEYPMIAVREAILNALVHRDYSVHTENTPVRIEMYKDRIEIINSGGLYGRVSIDSLGRVKPETRNAVLANILEVLRVTENRFSGIPTMRVEMNKVNLPQPEFVAERGEFKVVMRNIEYLRQLPIEDAIVAFCASEKSREEIVSFVGKSQNYVMSKLVNPLVAKGMLRLTIPEKPKSSYQRYIKNQ